MNILSVILKCSSYPIFQNSCPNLLDFVNHFCSFNMILHSRSQETGYRFFSCLSNQYIYSLNYPFSSHHVRLKIKTPYCRSPFYVNFLMLLKFLNKPIDTLQRQSKSKDSNSFLIVAPCMDHHGFLLKFYFCYITNCQTAIMAVCEK